MPVFEYLHRPNEVVLILIESSMLLCVSNSPFNSHALTPALISIWHKFVQFFIELNEAAFGGINGCDIPESRFKEEGFFFWKLLIHNSQSFLDYFPFLTWLANAIFSMIECTNNVGADLMIENPF